MKEKKNKKTIFIIAGSILAFTVLIGMFFIFAGKNGVYIYTETSGGFLSPGVTKVYRVGSFPFLKFRVSEHILDDEMDETKGRAQSAYQTVCEADPLAYYNKYYDGVNLVFPYKDLIYYHRDGVKGKIYEYNTKTGAIREIVSNHPSSFAIGTDQFMDESAAVLGILDYYPELNSIFDHKKGIIWNVFYDYKGDRIFLEHSTTIYEYLPDRKILRKVFNAGNTLNVRGVYSSSPYSK